MRLFCPPNSTKPKDIHFMVKRDKEKQQILSFEKPELKIKTSLKISKWLRQNHNDKTLIKLDCLHMYMNLSSKLSVLPSCSLV